LQSHRWPAVVILLVVVVLTLSTGCHTEKRFSNESFDEIVTELSEERVLTLLGKPQGHVKFPDFLKKALWWKVDEKYYIVMFRDGKVANKLGPIKKDEFEEWMRANKFVTDPKATAR
jgi:hypothetical protein